MQRPIRPRLVVLTVAVMFLFGEFMYGAYWWGVSSGRSDARLEAARHEADLRQSFETSSALLRELARKSHETSSALLKELITRQMALREAGVSEWETVNRIREWAHANIEVATPGYLLDQDASFDFYNRSAAEILEAFFQDRGGVWCGGAAHALRKLYEVFGFQASTIDSGKPYVMTHAVTLVRIRDAGMEKTVIQDPTLNLTYVIGGGEPYDYYALLTALMQHQHGNVRRFRGSLGKANALVYPGDDDFYFDHVVAPDAKPVQVLPNGVKKYESRLSLESFERRFGERIHAFLRKEGHPAQTVYLFLYPISGSDPSVLERARQLTRRK